MFSGGTSCGLGRDSVRSGAGQNVFRGGLFDDCVWFGAGWLERHVFGVVTRVYGHMLRGEVGSGGLGPGDCVCLWAGGALAG